MVGADWFIHDLSNADGSDTTRSLSPKRAWLRSHLEECQMQEIHWMLLLFRHVSQNGDWNQVTHTFSYDQPTLS